MNLRNLRPLRPLVILWLTFLVIPMTALANSKAAGWCEQGNRTIIVSGVTSSTTTPVQRSFPNCTVTVYLAGTLTLAPIYSDNAVSPTPKANPFTAANDGQWFFYGANGKYDIVFSGTGMATYTRGDFQLYDPSDISITDSPYRCKGDGVTDNTACIQSALNDAAAVKRAVVVPPGIFMTYGNALPSNTTLKGTGTLRQIGGAPADLLYNSVQSSPGNTNINIYDITLDGNGSNQTQIRQSCIYFNEVTTFKIINTVISECRIHGFWADDEVRKGIIKQNLFINTVIGSNLLVGNTPPESASHEMIITENYLTGSGANAIFILGSKVVGQYGSSLFTVSNNTITDSGDVGIEIGSSSQTVTVTGNTVYLGSLEGATGIMVRSARNVSVAGNSVYGMDGFTLSDGYFLWGYNLDNTDLDSVVVAGNSAFNCKRAGFNFNSGNNITVVGNTAIGNTQYQFFINPNGAPILSNFHKWANSDNYFGSLLPDEYPDLSISTTVYAHDIGSNTPGNIRWWRESWINTMNTRRFFANNIYIGTNYSLTGTVNLPNGSWIQGRNSTNTGDRNMIRISPTNFIDMGGAVNMNNGARQDIIGIQTADIFNVLSTQIRNSTWVETNRIHQPAAQFDTAGYLNITGGTSATYNFTVAWGNLPSCTVTPTSDLGATNVRWWVIPSTTQITVFTHTAVTSGFAYHCIGQPQ